MSAKACSNVTSYRSSTQPAISSLEVPACSKFQRSEPTPLNEKIASRSPTPPRTGTTSVSPAISRLTTVELRTYFVDDSNACDICIASSRFKGPTWGNVRASLPREWVREWVLSLELLAFVAKRTREPKVLVP